MKRFDYLVFGLLTSCALTSCTAENPAYNPDPFLPGECRVGVEVTETFQGYEKPDLLDILVVIDNSGDVEDLQVGLADAIPAFLEGLDEDGMNVQLAVATTDGTGRPKIAGPGTTGEGCATNSANIARPEQPNWTKIAACNVQQGNSGDPYQQALAVVEGLFFDIAPEETGFFRSDARLLVMIVSNEDDCSHDGSLPDTEQPRRECLTNQSALQNVKLITDNLAEVPQTKEGLLFAVVSGPPVDNQVDDQGRVRPVCSSALGSAYSASRLFEATQAFGDQGVFMNLCVQDLGTNLQTIRTRFVDQRASTFCPARKLAHEPLWIQGTDDDNDAFNILIGESGFVFEGITSSCENGAVTLMPDALVRAESFEVAYCVEQ